MHALRKCGHLTFSHFTGWANIVFGGVVYQINSKHPPRSKAPSAHCSWTNLPVTHSPKGSSFLFAAHVQP